MPYTPPTIAGLAVEPNTSSTHLGRIASPSGQLLHVMPLMRKYEVAHLTPSLEISVSIVSAPALPVIENAFAAFGRGAVVPTQNGPVAIEDLQPGDQVMTIDHGLQTLLWHGAMTLMPDDRIGKMTRLTTDALGYARPSYDLVLGPSARILYKNSALAMLTGTVTALVRAHDFVDGSQIIALSPISPVRCYQLGFAKHCCINVNGIDVATLHLGTAEVLRAQPDLHPHLAKLFPHRLDPTDFGELVAPQLRNHDIDLIRAA